MIVFLNGHLMPAEQATISIDDRGFLAADGVFETALLHDGGFFRLGQHLERFAASAAAMRIAAPAAADLDAIVRRVVRENGMRSAAIRITLTRGVRNPTLLVTARLPDPAQARDARRGWHLITAATRRPSTASVPAQLKALGRTYALLARHEAAAAGADDALLLTDDGYACEGPTWNIFWRTGDSLCTPALEAGVLAGVTRSVISDLAPAAGLSVREGPFPRPDLDRADEIFATMTSVGIVPVRQLDGRRLPSDTPAADALLPLYWHTVQRDVAADPA
jgi:branched-chain amino acid aminotransferase